MIVAIGAAITKILSWSIFNMKLVLELLKLIASGVTTVRIIYGSA